ncbi:MAG TPA: hypothetical protein VGL77_10905, partial [Armatimonadota bacterium]
MTTIRRGHFVRALSITILIFWMLPALILAITSVGFAVAGSGQQSILLLPIAATAEGIPNNLAAQMQSQLQAALLQRPGVQVDILNRNSRKLLWAKTQLDDAGQTQLLKNYDTAQDVNALADDRLKAAAALVEKLGMDAIVYGKIDGYEIGAKPRQVQIHFTGTAVSLERLDTGKFATDPQGNLIPLATPLSVVSKSRVLPKSELAVEAMNNDAVATVADTVAAKVTGSKRQGSASTVSEQSAPVSVNDQGEKRHSGSGALWILLALVVVAAAAGGGGGGGTPKQIVPEAPSQLSAQVYPSDLSGSNYYIQLSWQMTSNAKPISFDIYRDDNLGFGGSRMATSSIKAGAILRGPLGGRYNPGMARANDRRIRTSARRPVSALALGSGSLYQQGIAGTARHFQDMDVSSDIAYTYHVVANYADGTSSDPMANEITRTISSSPNEVGTISAEFVNNLMIAVTWTAPGTPDLVINKYKIYRTTTFPAGRLVATRDELKAAYDISGASGDVLPTATTFNDPNPVYGAVNSYVVVPYHTVNNVNTATDGPYPVAQVVLDPRPWTGTIDAYAVTIIGSQRIYYSADPHDVLTSLSESSSDVKIQALAYFGNGLGNLRPTIPLNAEGAVVTLTTDRGSFGVRDPATQVLVDSQRLTCKLDPNGQAVVSFQGRAADPNRSTFLPPAATKELKVPTINAVCNGNTITLNGVATALDSFGMSVPTAFPTLVGPPALIALTKTVPTPAIMPTQPDSVPVLFQGQTATLTAMVTDAAAQPVLAGMPIWFVQAWTPLTGQTVATTDYFNAANGPASVGTMPFAITDTNGRAQTGFTSDRSGLFTWYAYALGKDPDTKLLQDINETTVGGLTTDAMVEVKPNLLPADVQGTLVFAKDSLLCKTFAWYKNWHMKSVSRARINCSSNPLVPGDNAAIATFTAEDETGKRTLPGVYYMATPYRIINNTYLEMTTEDPVPFAVLQTLDKTTITNATPLMFNGQSETSFIIRGNQVIGNMGIKFNTQMGSQNFFHYDDVVTMYGPGLDEARDSPNPADPLYSLAAITMTHPHIDNAETWVRISGLSDPQMTFPTAPATAINATDITVQLRDIHGNPFPAGYLIGVESAEHTAGLPFSTYGVTKRDGTYSFKYIGAKLTARNQLIDNLKFTLYGENIISADQRSTDQAECSPGYSKFIDNTVIKSEHPDNNNGDFSPQYSMDIAQATVLPPNLINRTISMSVYTVDGNPVLSGYPINFMRLPTTSTAPVNVPGPVITTGTNGVVTATFSLGGNYGNGPAHIIAYYDRKDGSSPPSAGEIIGDTGWFTVGLDTPVLTFTNLSATGVTLHWKGDNSSQGVDYAKSYI